MVAIRRRPWLQRCCVLALAAVQFACSLVQPSAPSAAPRTQVERLVRDGKHAEAARAYSDLAANSPADRDYFDLQSTDQWVAAGNLAEARKALATISPEARTKLPILRALVAAELAYAENDGVHAIQELDQIAVPTQPDEAQTYWWIRGKSAFLTGHPVEGTRAYVERERWLSDPAILHASRQELYGRLRNAAERGTAIKVPPKTEPLIAGWLELGPVAAELARNPMRASAAVATWRQRYPQHPANGSVLNAADTQIAAATAFPDQIALLLPLSGPAEPVGVAVRDGFVAAYLEQSPNSRPHLRIYDVAAQTVAAAYSQAISDGAGFVVGPLTKEDVAAVVPLAAGHVPVLALNFLGDAIQEPKNFYQFALLPEDEARVVARKVVADGKLQGVAIFPDGELGDRVSAAFSDELSRLGGALVASARYETQRADFSDIIKQTLQVHGVKGEPSTHRGDAAFIFIAGTPGAARQIMAHLRFYYAGDIPVYATSQSFEPSPELNGDIDGMLFPDMPWMISSDPVTTQIRDSVRAAWPTRTARRDRLYAFGFDAFRLVPVLRGASPRDEGDVAGVSGHLHIDAHNRIRRDLEWAQIKNGSPAAF
jgi:outer membrane PBP1 activator LpoA protein